MTPQEALQQALTLLQRLIDHQHGLAGHKAREDAREFLREVASG